MLSILIGAAIGAAAGGALGYFGKCSGGGCPLMCDPVRGVLVGLMIGALFGFTTGAEAAKAAFTPSPHVRPVKDAAQFTELLNGNAVVLVDFYADWCGPCRRLKPTIHALADEYAGRVAVAAVNVDQARPLAGAYKVSGIPDVRIFHNGKQVEQLVGMRSASAYKARLDALVVKTAGNE